MSSYLSTFRFSHFSHFRFISIYPTFLLSVFRRTPHTAHVNRVATSNLINGHFYFFSLLNSSEFPNCSIPTTIGTISRQSSDFFQQLRTSSQSRSSALRAALILPNTFLTTISLSSQSLVSGFVVQSKAILQPVRCYCVFSHLKFTQNLRIFFTHPSKHPSSRKIR